MLAKRYYRTKCNYYLDNKQPFATYKGYATCASLKQRSLPISTPTDSTPAVAMALYLIAVQNRPGFENNIAGLPNKSSIRIPRMHN